MQSLKLFASLQKIGFSSFKEKSMNVSSEHRLKVGLFYGWYILGLFLYHPLFTSGARYSFGVDLADD